MNNFIDILGVRITPKVINFNNCEKGESYVRVINVQNISSKSTTVRFYPPQSKNFSLICKSHEKTLSAGLSHVCSLRCTMEVEVIMKDRLVVTVDGAVHEVEINVCPSAPNLTIDDEIDFGTVVMANKVISRQREIRNDGMKMGEFKLVYEGNKPLNIVPNEGSVHPQSSTVIQLEYVTREAQRISEVCHVFFEGQDPFTIRICGEVVKRSLELLDLASEERKHIECIRFPHTYYGSDKSEAALLFNNSPEKIQFVAILEEDTAGQESGSHITMTANGINPKECTNPLTSLITMYPNQGSLGPYEKTPVLFRFSPRWKQPKQAFKKTLEPPLQQKFAVFVKIQIVGSGMEVDGSDNGKEDEEDSLIKSQQLEVAVTGTATPILIELQPTSLNLGQCTEGDSKTENITIFNRSTNLSCLIDLPRKAHFSIEPKFLKISANDKADLTVTFCPKQIGEFNIKQFIKVLSFVKDPNNPFVEYEEAIYEIFFHLSGSCISTTKTPVVKYCTGIDPLMTNPIGLSAETNFFDLGKKYKSGPHAAYITTNAFASGGDAGSYLFKCDDANKHPYNNRTAVVAFPNDRAASIRPSEQHKEYRTILTRTKRHNFVDPDYAYEDEEMRRIRTHKDVYGTYIRKRHLLKKISKLNSKFAVYENDLNLGIIPGNKLTPKKLEIQEIFQKRNEEPQSNTSLQLLSSKELRQSDKIIDITKLNTFNAVPTTNIEKEECAKELTPQQLHKIVIGPSTVNFGDVCIRSTSYRDINVVNNLDKFIHITILIDCRELRQSSPLSQIIPAKTKSTFPLVFESNKKGKFQRNLSYVINGYYQNHVIVLANVVLNQLQLSTDCLFLSSSSIQPPDTGIRSTITMTNPLNHATEFLWEPVFHSSGGIAFSIRPKEGVVEAYSKLDCEVVFHPSFLASSEGDFILRSPGNEENSIEISTEDTMITENSPSSSPELKSNISLHCAAMLGNRHVSLQSRRVMFGNIPVNLSTSRTAILVNTGSNHAFFRVVPDALYEQYPGMAITPLKGSVPVGGQSELMIKYLPKTLLKFDFSVPVVIRGWKEIELKISGAVIIPQVEILQKRIDFGGVPVGSEKNVTFTLVNKSQCRALLEFDFSKQRDFSLLPEENSIEEHAPNKEKSLSRYELMLKPLQSIDYRLLFTPKEVAAYDFPLAIRINQIDMNRVDESRAQTNNSIQTSKVSNKMMSSEPSDIKSRPSISNNLVKQVTATATRQPITVSNNHFTFHFSSKSETKSFIKKLIIYNNMNTPVDLSLKLGTAEWKYGSDKSSMKKLSKARMIPFIISRSGAICNLTEDLEVSLTTLGEAIEIELSFAPDMHGFYTARIPVCINGDSDNIYQCIHITGNLESARLICQPESLVLLPAPLGTELSIDFKVVAINFDTPSVLEVKLPTILRPGSNDEYQPFKCSFLSKNEIQPISSEGQVSEIRVRMTFSSDVPINIRSSIVLSTDCGICRSVYLNATADNCLLSWQSFISQHQMEYHIVCEEGKALEGTEPSHSSGNLEFGEAQLKPLNKTGNSIRIAGSSQSLHSRNSTTVTSSNFEESSVTYEETMSESESAYMSTPIPLREGALNNIGEKSRDDKFKLSNTPSLKVQQRSDFIPLPQNESNSNTLDIGSSLTSEKGSSIQNNENIKFSSDNISSSVESHLYTDFDIPSCFDQELTLVVQRWFSMHGWPGNIHPVNIPVNFRTSLQKRFGHSQTTLKEKAAQNVDNMENTGLKSDSRDFYDMILYLTGRQILGINTTVCLPTNPIEKACHIYIQHATLIAFIESQGAQLAQIMPEYLMDVQEYELWYSVGCPGLPSKDDKQVKLDSATFDKVSKKSWTTVLLQIIKVFILVKVNYKGYRHALQVLHTKDRIPDVHPSPSASNCYSSSERIIFAWLNYLYDTFRSKVWPGSSNLDIGVAAATPPARWIINFDNDFMDSLVLATALAAYVPFLGESHFKYMYPNPQNPEQCLHNALKIVNALKSIGLEFDVQAIDIVDPNPVMMLLLSSQLFQTLPLYLPKSEISFTGGLHEHVTKHIQISNPSSKAITYECIIIGQDATDFSSPKGSIVNVAGKASVKWPIAFKSRFLRCAEALIMFIGRKTGSTTANNLIFTAKSKITSNNPSKTEKISEKCYILKKINLKVTSPYNKVGEFKVTLVENSDSQMKAAKDPGGDQRSSLQPMLKPAINKKNTLEAIKPQNKLRAFFCHSQSIFIDESKTGTLELFYLPFSLGVKTCSIIFSHDTIGEFLHYVEATADPPEPIPVVDTKTDTSHFEKKSIRVSSADAACRGLEGNDKVIYWKCEVGATVNETLSIPINNPYKEAALLAAAQKHLSPQEVSRRKITGTLNSSSLLLTAVHVLTLSSTEGVDLKSTKQNKKTVDTKYSNRGNLLDFEIEVDSTFFSAPSRIQIPDSLQYSVGDTTQDNKTVIKTVDVPVKFVSATAGIYPCDIILKGPDDVRLYRIECTVVPEGNSAQLFFKTPLQDMLIQNIPIVNKTKQDWPLRATISGTSAAFSGPDFIMAKALTVSQYALQFKPTKEGKINAKLSLYNEADGTEHIFELFGEGESPLALETLNFECNVGDSIKKTLQIPNSTRKKHVFSVESDLDWMMIGEDMVSVLPGRSSPYELTLKPNASGEFRGILAFISGKKKIIEYDSDGDELEDVFQDDDGDKDAKNEKNGLYRIWYSIFVNVHRGPPHDTLMVKCHCLQTTSVDIPISNPLADRDVTLKVKIHGPNLLGTDCVIINPLSTELYSLKYQPSKYGRFDGRLVFFDENIGEFWYKITLVSEPPIETTLPLISCSLGKWSVVEIPIRNLDLDSNLLIYPNISNPECFNIHIQDLEWYDHNCQSLCVPPNSERLLGVRFTPCDIGSVSHKCLLTLKSDMLGDWKFNLIGCGLPPKPCDVIGISAEAGSNMTLLIPFHNPLLETVLIDVNITEESQTMLDRYRLGAGHPDQETSEMSSGVFKLLLKNNKKLKLESKQSFEIPISFAPLEMRKYNAICSVVMRKRSGETITSEDDFNELIIPSSEFPSAFDRYSLRWLFPVKGVPEASAPANAFTTPLVQGPLRIETRERIELCLWGLPPAVSGEDFLSKKTRSAPINMSESEVMQPLEPLLQEFTTELKVTEPDHEGQVDSKALNEAVKVFLVKENKQIETGMTILTYEIRFKPLKKFRLIAQLRVTSTAGGVWLFPVRFVSHECDPDDEIVLEAVALNKPISVRFHLNSKTFEPTPFKAYFLKGGDLDFSVIPESGVLLAMNALPDSGPIGLPFIVTWTPKSYSRSKGARLVIETEKMEWVYKFVGVNPQYIVPHSNSIVRSNWSSNADEYINKIVPKKKNFVRENLDLTCTAVSSPIKGATLFPKIA